MNEYQIYGLILLAVIFIVYLNLKSLIRTKETVVKYSLYLQSLETHAEMKTISAEPDIPSFSKELSKTVLSQFIPAPGMEVSDFSLDDPVRINRVIITPHHVLAICEPIKCRIAKCENILTELNEDGWITISEYKIEHRVETGNIYN